jgi:hypothetical protein
MHAHIVEPCKTWGKGHADGLVYVSHHKVVNLASVELAPADCEKASGVYEPALAGMKRSFCHTTLGEWASAYHPESVEKLATQLMMVA